MKYNPPEDDKTMKWLEWFGFLCLVSGIVLGFYWFGIKLVVVLALFGISRIIMSVVNDYKKEKINQEEAKEVIDIVKKMAENESKEK